MWLLLTSSVYRTWKSSGILDSPDIAPLPILPNTEWEYEFVSEMMEMDVSLMWTPLNILLSRCDDRRATNVVRGVPKT